MTVFTALLLSTNVLAAGGPSKNYAWGKVTADDGKLCLTQTGKRFQFQSCTAQASRQNFVYTSKDQLRFRFEDGNISDECVDIPTESSGKAGTALQIWKCGTSTSSSWKIQPVTGKSGTFRIVSSWNKASAKCLTNAGANKDIVIEDCNEGNKDQQFGLTSTFSKNAYDAFPKVALDVYQIGTENWMEKIYEKSPQTLLKDIIIPGTHDSGTYKSFSKISTTQDRSIYQSLEDGIRYIDLRIGAGGKIVHGIEKGPSGSVKTVLDDIAKFAKKNPKEIIFVDMHEVPLDEAELKNLKGLIDGTIKDRLVPTSSVSWISFQQLWNMNKNIILLVRAYTDAAKVLDKNVVWNKSLGGKDINFTASKNPHWAEVWPDSTVFSEIYDRNLAGLKKRASKKWHMSQLLRTPRVGDAVVSVLGLKGGVLALVTEKTADGAFHHSISKWVVDWVNSSLPVNFVATDFYNLTNVVPSIIWLNYRIANGL